MYAKGKGSARRIPPAEGQPPHQSGERVQADTLFLRDLSGRGIYQLTVCDRVSKLTAAELLTTPSAHNMRAAFEHIPETFQVVIRSPDRQRLRVPRNLRGTLPGARHGHAGHPALQAQTEWLRRAVPAHLAQGATKPPPSQSPSTSTGGMPGGSWFPTTMSGPMPHRAEGRPSGIYANTLERASAAT